jgi:hypothetical protein
MQTVLFPVHYPNAQAGHDEQESVAWRLAKAWSFVTYAITIACSAGPQLRGGEGGGDNLCFWITVS